MSAVIGTDVGVLIVSITTNDTGMNDVDAATLIAEVVLSAPVAFLYIQVQFPPDTIRVRAATWWLFIRAWLLLPKSKWRGGGRRRRIFDYPDP